MHQTHAPGGGPPLLDWFAHSSSASLKAVALVIHGLNLNPVRMAPIIAALNEAGIDAARLSLQGHGLNFEGRQGLGEIEVRIIDEASVGKTGWAGIKTAMIAHLLGNSVSPEQN
jgi:hypothetical protein